MNRIERWKNTWAVCGNRRMIFLTLLSFSSGLPFGFVVFTVPVWLRTQKIGLETIGIFALASMPWGLKFFWAPFLDRYKPRWPGPRRGWILAMQAALALAVFSIASINPGTAPWTTGFLVFIVSLLSATQDIAIDAYAVEIMKPEEYGIGNGMRASAYRIAMLVSGGLSVAAAAYSPWSVIFAFIALLFVVGMAATLLAVEPAESIKAPADLREAVIEPFLSFIRVPRAFEIALFIFLYKAGDSIAGHMMSPFLVDQGYHMAEIGLAQKTVGLVAVLIGTMSGGFLTSATSIRFGLALGAILQASSNVGYWLMAVVGFNRPVMYSAVAVENFCAGVGSAALMAFLTSLCVKRYCAAQYALFTSFFGLSRSLTGPAGGYLAVALGYQSFFALSILVGVPAILLLLRIPNPQIASADDQQIL